MLLNFFEKKKEKRTLVTGEGMNQEVILGVFYGVKDSETRVASREENTRGRFGFVVYLPHPDAVSIIRYGSSAASTQ